MNLYTTQYSLDILKKNIYALDLYDILKTQKLTAKFVVHYILNFNYQLTNKEEKLTLQMVLDLQPHIKLYEIVNEQLIYESDTDSVEDFDACSKRH